VVGNYTLRDVARITGVSRARLRYWERTSLLEPQAPLRPDDRPTLRDTAPGVATDRDDFGFRDLVDVRSVLTLLDRGVSLRRIRSNVRELREKMPEVDLPLRALRPWTDGSRRVVVRHDGALVEPNGQLVLDFAASAGAPAVALHSPQEFAQLQESAMEWFEQGCKLDSNRATFGEAIDAYRKAIECDATFADAHCNLGSVYFNQDRMGQARECFETALSHEPHHVESNLNLATLLEEEHRYQLALRHYRIALDADPLAADTHVSLALLYEKIGLRRKARGHWQRYLQLDPGGTWSETARQRLDSD
jgi:hypothetical protein